MIDTSYLMAVHPVSKATRDLCERVGRARTASYAGAASQRRLNRNADVIGAIGEALVAHLVQIPWATDVSHRGDSGEDFPGTDVKSIPMEFASDEGLLRRFADSPRWADHYMLVVVQEDWAAARYAGYCLGSFLAKAPRREYGHGATCVRHERELLVGLPPPIIEAMKGRKR